MGKDDLSEKKKGKILNTEVNLSETHWLKQEPGMPKHF